MVGTLGINTASMSVTTSKKLGLTWNLSLELNYLDCEFRTGNISFAAGVIFVFAFHDTSKAGRAVGTQCCKHASFL